MKARIIRDFSGNPMRKKKDLDKDRLKELYIHGYTEFAQIILVEQFGFGTVSIAGKKLKIDRFAEIAEERFSYYNRNFKLESKEDITSVIVDRIKGNGVNIQYVMRKSDSFREYLIDIISLCFIETLTGHFRFGTDDVEKFVKEYNRQISEYSQNAKLVGKPMFEYMEMKRKNLRMKTDREFLKEEEQP